MTLTRLQKKYMNEAANILMNIKNSKNEYLEKQEIYPKNFHQNTKNYIINQNIHENSIRQLPLNGLKKKGTHNFVRWNILIRYINNWKEIVINKKNELEKNKLKLIEHELNELQEIKHLKDLLEIKKKIIQFHISEFNELESKISKCKIQYRMNYPNPKI